MNKDILRLRLQDFRAIKEADIKLDGITLVSGVNSCGKSTLSRLLYHIIDDANNYDRLIEAHFARKFYALRDTVKRLEVAFDDIQRGRDREVPQFSGRMRTSSLASRSISSLLGVFLDLRQKSEFVAPALSEVQRERILKIISNGLSLEGSFEGLLDILEEKLKYAVSEIERVKLDRPSQYALGALNDVFDENLDNSDLCLWEYGSVLLHASQDRIDTPVAIDRSIYIDSPISLGLDDFSFSLNSAPTRYWSRLGDLLVRGLDNHALPPASQSRLELKLEKDILGGVSTYQDEAVYTFTRSDGKVFNLLECATGVKAFSIIQMLLRNGWLTRQTLLIIDEPEAHLHPQWIVEYARLIVLLNKHIGVKFFLASHSPDMVSAIKYISESEGVSDVLNFYLAEEVDQTMQYRYKPLGTDIEPIFASFNIALDRIDQYGATQTAPES